MYLEEDEHAPRHAVEAERDPRLPRWLLPAILGLLTAVAAIAALLLDEHPTASALGVSGDHQTPVLSARRAPEIIAAPVADRRLTADLQIWIAQSPPNSCLAVEAGNRTLFTHNVSTPLPGASTQKLLTASALLEVLGPDERLTTSVRAASAPVGGVVQGDLFVVGGGDPLWDFAGFAQQIHPAYQPSHTVDPAQLADAIVAAGITRIEGSVVGDGSRYDTQRYHPSWPSRFYGSVIGPVGALAINDGRSAGYSGGPTQTDDPALSSAQILTELLIQRGVTIAGPPRSAAAPSGSTEVAVAESATVREIVAEMLKDSDNSTAEMLFKEIGRRRGDAGSWPGGAAATTQLLAEAGMPMEGVQVVDGSGLSTDNRLTCQLLVELLGEPETGPVLVEGLAVAGESGTLTERWDGTPVEGRLRAKTGTLNSVTALSGLVTPTQGGSLTFAYVANPPEGQNAATIVPLQDGLANILISYPRNVDISVLLPAGTSAG